MKGKLFRGATVAVCMSLAVGGCAMTPQDCRLNQTATGALVGAAAGGALGGIAAGLSGVRSGAALAIVAGAVLVGAAIGAVVGHHNDQVCHQMALQQALDQAVAANAEWQAREAQRQQEDEEAKAAAERAQHQPAHRTTSAAASPPTPVTPTKPVYMTVEWANRMTNTTGAITPLNSITVPAVDQACMEFSDTQIVGGETKIVNGKACRGSDGKWNPIE